MLAEQEKENRGAWIVHHARKIAMDVEAPSEYSVLDEAGKAADLLMKLAEAKEAQLSREEVLAVGRSARLNPRSELPHYLKLLKEKRVIDEVDGEVVVLGVNTRGVLRHAVDIFEDGNPKSFEVAAIELGELASKSPIYLKDAQELIGDSFEMNKSDVADFLRRSVEIGFVDQEGDDNSNTLLFNGNLFKRDSVEKSARVLSSLSSNEQNKLNEVMALISAHGCLSAVRCEEVLQKDLFEKLKAAAVFEINTVSNELGEHAFVTLPGAFHKFVNPIVDDSFDLAKALVSALAYGMQLRSSSQGRIISVDWILNALISGRSIGPATAIGADYRVLEQNRVVKLTPAGRNMYRMRLLKKDIGELALQVLKRGEANAETLSVLPGAPMLGYKGPETTRELVRKNQSQPSKRKTHDILSALRGRRSV